MLTPHISTMTASISSSKVVDVFMIVTPARLVTLLHALYSTSIGLYTLTRHLHSLTGSYA